MPTPAPTDDTSRSASPETTQRSSPAASPASELDFETELSSKQLGEFRILRPLGRGGMSEVYLAEQTSLHRQVAIKVLRRELLADPTVVQRFEQEAKAAAGLIHPNIVQIYSFGEHEGIHFIAQEYVPGQNLRQYLNRKGPPDLLVAYHLMRQVTAALTAAGDAGIVHRDIKPENILITRKGEAKVVDFGLAQLAESEHRVQLTQVGMTVGTPLYMSPEQINGDPVDHRSDIYSFGVTCYRMLAGHPPFRGETSLSLAMQHLTQIPEPLSDARTDLPPVVCEIVHKMMARKPSDRYQSAREITQDLKQVARVLKEDPEGAAAVKLGQLKPKKRPENWTEAFFGWPLVRHALTLSLMAAIIGGASAGIGWWMRPRNPLESPVTAKDAIPRLASAKVQFEHATQLHTEDGWRAVLEYFPDDHTYNPLAKERLAVLDLENRRLDDAQKLFDELEAMGRENSAAKSVGIAGHAVIASLRGNYSESQRLIVFELGNLGRRRAELSDDLWFLLQRAGRENVRHLGDQANKQLKELFEEEQ